MEVVVLVALGDRADLTAGVVGDDEDGTLGLASARKAEHDVLVLAGRESARRHGRGDEGCSETRVAVVGGDGYARRSASDAGIPDP